MKNHRYSDKCKSYVLNWKTHVRTNLHKLKASEYFGKNVRIIKEAFNSRIRTYCFDNDDERILDPTEFMNKVEDYAKDIQQEVLSELGAFKLGAELFAEYIKLEGCDQEDFQFSIKSFQAPYTIIFDEVDINRQYENIKNIINKQTDDFQEKGSGWGLVRIIHLELNICQYQPIRNSSFDC